LFDELFPRSAAHFDVSALSSAEWRDGMDDNYTQHLWSVTVLADELLRATASFHGTGDYFLTRRHSSRLFLFRQEIAAMANRKPKDAIRDTSKAEWKGFLDFRLTDELLAELDNWKPTPKQIWEVMDKLIASGYRATLSYNPRTHLASCTLIDDDPTRKTGGYALSSADEDGALALKMATFKHLKLGEDWSSLLGHDAPKGKRG